MKLNGVLVHGWVTLRLAMSDEECRLRIIGWLIEGLGIDDTDADGRTLHLQVRPSDLPLLSEVDLERAGLARLP